MDGYIYLAIAVVEQAAKDYRRKMRKHGKAPDIERFFHSEYGDLLCFGKADMVLERLKDEHIKGKKPSRKAGFKYGMVPRKERCR
jgi:hypothetical protein